MHKESTLRKTSKRAMLFVLFMVLIIQCIYFLQTYSFWKKIGYDILS
jgi:hypothetical protein